MKRMVIVAHPDDEVLGLGGYLYDRIQDGDDVCVVIANDANIPTRPDMANGLLLSHGIIGIREWHGLDLMNLSISAYSPAAVVPMIEKIIKDFAPDMVYTHSPTDINPDHRAVSALTQQAARYYQRQPHEHRISGLFYMEVPSATDWGYDGFVPDTFLSISDEGLKRKIDALACYQNVLRQETHPRSDRAIRALAVLRGSTVGVKYAEVLRTGWRIGGLS